MAFAGSHGHVAGLLASHLGDAAAEPFLAAAAAAYERLGANEFLTDLQTARQVPTETFFAENGL